MATNMDNEDTPIPRYTIGEMGSDLTPSGPSEPIKEKKQPQPQKENTSRAPNPVKEEAPAPLSKKLPGKINPSKINEDTPRTATVFFFAIVLGILLFVSFVFNIMLLNKISGLEFKMDNNSSTFKAILKSKESLAEKKLLLEKELDTLKADALNNKLDTSGMSAENNRLRSELEKETKKYSLLEEELKSYAQEVKELAMKEISYYDAYKKKASELDDALKQTAILETTISGLKSDTKNIELQLKETEASHSYDMAVTYTQVRMFDEAIANFEKYFQVHPDSAQTAYNIAYIYDTVNKNKQKAVEYYTKYLKLAPEADDRYEIEARVRSLARS
ncbi:MAG: tetratricopeptide repeat protein [Candidatus Omnitrophica bacterium]|nr:tetratricopeptide repeat protein [Candidatus Omnitrophota bacterium]